MGISAVRGCIVGAAMGLTMWGCGNAGPNNVPVDTLDSPSHAGGSASPSGSGSSSGGGGSGGASSATFNASGTFADAVSGNALGNVSVCLLDSPSTCATTDSGGNFSLDGVGQQGSGLVASLAGYVTGLWPMTPAGDTTWSLLLRTTTRMNNLAAAVNTTFGPSTGAIFFQAYDGAGNALAGVTVSVASAGPAAYFQSDDTTLDATLTATTSAGKGFVFGLSPGTTRVTFSAPGLACARNGAEGWPPAGGETMTVPVVANELTRAAAVCR
jgi:hypothetical protein